MDTPLHLPQQEAHPNEYAVPPMEGPLSYNPLRSTTSCRKPPGECSDFDRLRLRGALLEHFLLPSLFDQPAPTLFPPEGFGDLAAGRQ
ncbi:hypothetical protein GCM10027570_44660 [Streptomonospora sediminis]